MKASCCLAFEASLTLELASRAELGVVGCVQRRDPGAPEGRVSAEDTLLAPVWFRGWFLGK
jgi:hypothetical protein